MIETAEEFRRLRLSEDPADYGRAAAEDAPLEVWREVCRRWPELRFWVAQNKTVPVAVLVDLATDADVRVRSMVASKRTLPLELQVRLAGDPDDGVRAALASNAKLADDVREHLASDDQMLVREAVARWRGTG